MRSMLILVSDAMSTPLQPAQKMVPEGVVTGLAMAMSRKRLLQALRLK
jgi:hypothetical protein